MAKNLTKAQAKLLMDRAREHARKLIAAVPGGTRWSFGHGGRPTPPPHVALAIATVEVWEADVAEAHERHEQNVLRALKDLEEAMAFEEPETARIAVAEFCRLSASDFPPVTD